MKFEDEINQKRQERIDYINKSISTPIEDYLEKARSGIYSNTPENRKLGRVGQKYGEKREETSIEQKIVKIEEDIIKRTGNKYECLCFLDKGGKNILGILDGETSSVTISKENLPKIKGAEVATHNHPSSRGFSMQDIYLSLINNVKEVRAITPNSIFGEGVFIFKNKDSEDKSSAYIENIQKQIERKEPLIREQFNGLIEKEGDDGMKIANSLHSISLFLSTNAGKAGIAYNTFEMYFKKKSGEKVDIIDFLKSKNIKL